MMNAQSYFRKISDLLIDTEVTDQNGSALTLDKGIETALQLILQEGKKIMVIGNGGSAAIASHVHNDLCHTVGIQAMVFNDSSQLTALSNDYGYQCVFERPIGLWAKSGDLLIAISSSGNSENILRGVQAAKLKGCNVISFSGFKADNPLRQVGHLNFYIASESYGQVEISHLTFAHFLTDCAAKSRNNMIGRHEK